MADTASLGAAELPLWREYLELCKPRVVALICFTAVVGMLLAVPGMVPLNALVAGNLGIFLAASAAAVINQVVDARVDAQMDRTRHRPLPTGRVTAAQALVFAAVLAVLSMTLLVVWVNVLTAVLTFASLIGYAVIYTAYLKRATPQNIVIGGAAGAAPPVLGWTAVTGSVDPPALLLFLIIFVWTPPHFWALAIRRHEEYARVNIPMLPVTHGLQYTRLHVLLYAALLLAVSLLPFATHFAGWPYAVAALLLGGRFLQWAVRLYRTQDSAVASATFRYSIIYLMGLFAALLVDHYLPGHGLG
ncbi:heme o synthase [Immundisolibacter sp.]|uniref:heme o synthase n=1 Tax=Immundisolibacter sp. TaxID=1934948 RepID=UPI002611478F|nr:heme o synthase [Immundisolibacter sp.]MDD3650244.1 heme o synthase [Immundisolibacter sp.]